MTTENVIGKTQRVLLGHQFSKGKHQVTNKEQVYPRPSSLNMYIRIER